MKKIFLNGLVFLSLLLVTLFLAPSQTYAHCDTLDGPVIKSARKALESENVNYVLIWVKPENEEEIRKALRRSLKKRKKAKSQAEKDKADLEFFETLVRVHREGEGAGYVGIKPAGSVEQEIALADQAVETGNLANVLDHINSPEKKKIVRRLFDEVKQKSNYEINDITAGREFIESYVVFLHSVAKAIKGIR